MNKPRKEGLIEPTGTQASTTGTSEAAGAVSALEQKFDRVRKRSGLVLAPLVFIVLWHVPMHSLSDTAHRLLAVFGLVVTLWITEAIPLAVTALAGPALCVLCGVASEKEIFRSFGNPILFLFMGSFMLAQAMLHHGLNRRIAYRILGLGWVAKSPARVLAVFAFVTGGLSMWISNTSAVAMVFPIGIAILTEMARRKSELTGALVRFTDLKYGVGLMLAAAFASSIGGMATPIGTPPNLIGLGFLRSSLGRDISFFHWVMFGIPLAVVLLGALVLYLNRVCPAEPGLLGDSRRWIRDQQSRLGPISTGERNVLFAFGVTICLWLLPGFVALFAGVKSPLYLWLSARLPEGVCALLGGLLLFILPVNLPRGEFTLSWREAQKIDWGTILLFGGGLAMGEMMFSSGLAKWVGEGLASALATHTTLGVVVLFTLISVVLTETTSNTATATMLVPIAAAVAQAAGVDPLQPVLATCLASSLAFMLPVSTPPNAVVYGSGSVPLMAMVRHGFMLDVISVCAVIAAVYWLVPWILGAPGS